MFVLILPFPRQWPCVVLFELHIMWLSDLYTKGKGESSLLSHPDMSPSIHWLENSKHFFFFSTGEERVTAVQINSTIIHSSIYNSILIWYQYILKSIDYTMFYSVTRILLMHFLHLALCLCPWTGPSDTIVQHVQSTGFLNQTDIVNIAVVRLQPTDGLQTQWDACIKCLHVVIRHH